MPDAPTPAQLETFAQTCTRLIFQARDDCVKQGKRITTEIVESIISEQQRTFSLIPTKPVFIDGIAEAIFRAYPRREGKAAALKVIEKAMRTVPSTELLQKTLEYRKAVEQWPASFRYTKEGRDIVPHPRTWFHQGRYHDDQSAWTHTAKKEAGNGNGVNYTKF